MARVSILEYIAKMFNDHLEIDSHIALGAGNAITVAPSLCYFTFISEKIKTEIARTGRTFRGRHVPAN